MEFRTHNCFMDHGLLGQPSLCHIVPSLSLWQTLRHLEVSTLWLQDKVSEGKIKVHKVPGEDNIADALTKPVDQAVLIKHLAMTNSIIEPERHEIMPRVTEDQGCNNGEFKEEDD